MKTDYNYADYETFVSRGIEIYKSGFYNKHLLISKKPSEVELKDDEEAFL